jgi:GNAT superfamily N-acetyltransferase
MRLPPNCSLNRRPRSPPGCATNHTRISHDGARVVEDPIPLAVNVYTQPEWRGQGIARALMNVLMEWAVGQGSDRLVLHASDAGRPLYLSLGFEATNEMRWFPTG